MNEPSNINGLVESFNFKTRFTQQRQLIVTYPFKNKQNLLKRVNNKVSVDVKDLKNKPLTQQLP